MLQWIRFIRKVIKFICSPLGCLCMREYYYIFIVNLVSSVHLALIFGNLLSIVLLIAYEPIYVWLPLITLLVSPVIGGSHCWLNRLENMYRMRVCMPLITDRFEEFLENR